MKSQTSEVSETLEVLLLAGVRELGGGGVDEHDGSREIVNRE